MLKAIKEIIIMLLVCLVGILLFAVVFYEYIPARKIVAEVSTYTTSEEVEELLADDIDSQDSDVILTFQEGNYEVTSSDLNGYEATDDYVPGKANPFAAVADDVDDDASDTNSNKNSNTNSNTNTNNTTSGGNTTTNSNTDDDEYFKDTGTK